MKDKILLNLLMVLGFSVMAEAQTQQQVLSYIEKYKDVAIQEMNRCRIPASIKLAQGIHESGAGTSVLCQNSNNHFGIKCHKEWEGKGYRHDDDAPQECFRVYEDPLQSFIDHSNFLRTRKWYQPLFSLSITDYKGWAYGLKKSGYATNPKYPQIIIKTIEDYQLWRFDIDSAIADTPLQPPTATATQPKTDTAASAPKPISEKEQKIMQLSRIKINQVEGIVWDGSVAIEEIAAHYRLAVEEIKIMNDLISGGRFKKGDLIFLQPKKDASEHWQYEIGNGETMWQVAQKFAVKLDSLYKRNSLNWGDEVAAGEVIVLRGERVVPIRASAIQRTRGNAAVNQKANDTKIYFVQPGDTLYQIAKKFNTNMDDLIRLNNLQSNQLSSNQKLTIP